MKFALNYSPQAAVLLKAGKIQIDLFKCPDWDDLVTEAAQFLPVYVHFPFQAGQQDVNQARFEKVKAWLDRTGTYYVNTHVSVQRTALPDPDNTEAVIALVLPDVMQMAEYFGADRIIVENIPYPETKNTKPLTGSDATVISRIIEASNTGLLLDIGHARRTAEHLAIDPRLYIQQLPVHRLREIHVTGLGYDEHGRRIDHLSMTEEDWLLLEWALDNIHRGEWAEPWVVACEYGGIGEIFAKRSDPAVIAAQIPRMYEMVYAMQPV
jgi:uncharacterized protein (UPF0276 family)